ncbi:MAG: Leucine-rich repeat (LRR) protein [Mariniblastus sp.]|jgi:Leucine-rich repeat (LRR) protein
MICVFKRWSLFVCLLIAAVTLGCETDYEPLLMKKKIKDLEEEVVELENTIEFLKINASQPSSANSVVGSVAPIEPPVPSFEPQPASVPAETATVLSAEQAIMDELEDTEAFFLVGADGFATEADLAECRNGNEILAKLVDFSRLTNVALDGTTIDSATFSMLSKMAGLKTLSIERSTPTADDFEKLKGLKNLTFLQLHKSTLSEEAVKKLSEFPKLEQIRCGQTRVGDAELQHLSALKTLKAIDLSDCNRVTVEGLKSLSKCPKLSFLKVWGDAIDDSALEYIAAMKSLTVLGLNDTNVTDNGFKQLAGLDLREIHLFRTSIGDETLKVISEMPNIVTLNLRDTRLSDQGIEYLTKLKKLQKLDLSECNAPGITDASGEKFAKFTELTQLNLWATKFSDKGLEPVTALRKLTWLNLDNTKVTDDGVLMLKQMPQLNWLHLGKTDITDREVKTLMGLGNLKYLNITYTGVSEDMAYEIDDELSPKGCDVRF